MKSSRNAWVDSLRSSITILVVAHHAALAYTSFSYFDSEVYIRSTHPVVDTSRWQLLDFLVIFNDKFFMALMFFIGGLFICKSIGSKGKTEFLKDRFQRIFIPFLLLGTSFMLIAYVPAYILSDHNTDFANYIDDFFTRQAWPVGPPWFLWLLFLFNLLAVIIFSMLRKWDSAIKRIKVRGRITPILFGCILFVSTTVLYTPLAVVFGENGWTGIGPFDFQSSRVLLYFGYFFIGMLVGRTDFNNGVFAQSSIWVKHWYMAMLAAITGFAITHYFIYYGPLALLIENNSISEVGVLVIKSFSYSLVCSLASLAFIGLFRRYATAPGVLSSSAYLIYLIHYIFVVWLQYIFLPVKIPAGIKFALVFSIGLSVSWGLSRLLRKLAIVRNYL